MKSLVRLISLGAIACMGLLAAGCNETTHKDVTAAREQVTKEKQKLDDMKREEARRIEDKKQAENRTANKPVVDADKVTVPQPDDSAAVERERARAQERLTKQGEKLQEAKATAKDKEDKLANEQSRDTFLIDCKAAIDLANRGIEKLETKKNAADEDGKKALDDQIATIKIKRDHLQKQIDTIRAAGVMVWSKHHDAAQKAMDDLDMELKEVS